MTTPTPAGTPASYSQASGPVPGRTLGIVAFVVSIFLSLIGVLLGIVALVQSRKAGVKNGWALAAIVVCAVILVATIVITSVVVGNIAEAIRVCTELGSGSHVVDGVTVTCS